MPAKRYVDTTEDAIEVPLDNVERVIYKVPLPAVPPGGLLLAHANFSLINKTQGNIQVVGNLYHNGRRLTRPNGSNATPAEHYYVVPEIESIEYPTGAPAGPLELRIRCATFWPDQTPMGVAQGYGQLAGIIIT